MSYTKITDFAAKDALLTGDPNKIIKGVDLGVEFDAIVVDNALKATLDLAQTWTAAQTFRAANAIRSEAALTQDAVVIAGRGGGTGSYAATITPAALGANITLTLPAATGTLATLAGSEAFTNKSYNGMTVTASTGTFTLTNAKTLAVTNTLTLSGTDSTVMTFPPTSVSVGYLDVPSNPQSGATYTLALTDAGKHIYITDTCTVTIPTNGAIAFPVGSTITIINNAAAVTTFTTTSLTVYKAGTSAAWASGGTLSIRGMCTWIKVATDTWFVNGTTLS